MLAWAADTSASNTGSTAAGSATSVCTCAQVTLDPVAHVQDQTQLAPAHVHLTLLPNGFARKQLCQWSAFSSPLTPVLLRRAGRKQKQNQGGTGKGVAFDPF